MKVLQINSVCGIGSTGRIATDIHDILINQGHESYIAYGRDLPRRCNTSIRIGTEFDNYVNVVLTRLFDEHGFGSKKATKEFIEKIKKLNPDIIHLHNIHGYYINIEILFEYIKDADKPVIWTLHDCWSFTGHCSYFDYVGCNKWRKGCYDCPQKKEYPSSLYKDNSEINYKIKKSLFTGVKNLTIVTPSEWLAGLVKKSFLSEYSIEVINNGIDLEVFKPSKTNFREINRIVDKYVILGVASSWDRRKGLDIFLEISKLLKNDEIIVLVGLNKKQIKNLPANIIGISRTNNIKELAEIYSAANVFLNPTNEDNFPTTNIEALACGTPVITFDTGGSKEAINENTGKTIEKGKIQELISVLTGYKLKENNSHCSMCVERAHKLFNKDDRFNDYLGLYKDIQNNI